jgi:NTE family protein
MAEAKYAQGFRLGFSGGGFRATFYCLGAYRRLVELGMHREVTAISSVSGGSITAGAIMLGLAEGDFSSLQDFDQRVTSKLVTMAQGDLRQKVMKKASVFAYLIPAVTLVSGFAGALLFNWVTSKTSAAFPALLDKILFKGTRLKDLPLNPEWSCNATCLNTLRRFRFKPTGMYGNKLGSSTDIGDISVAFAVAASAAYPFVFAPLRLATQNRTFIDAFQNSDCIPVPQYVYLTDGGVYDNLGSETLLKDEMPFVMLDASSDTALTEFRPTTLELGKRMLATTIDQVVALRRRLLFVEQKRNGIQLLLHRPIAETAAAMAEYHTISLPEYADIDPALEELTASLRIDFDLFEEIEIEMLMWAGAIRMDLAMRVLYPDCAELLRLHPPRMPDFPVEHVRAVLRRGGNRRTPPIA